MGRARSRERPAADEEFVAGLQGVTSITMRIVRFAALVLGLALVIGLWSAAGIADLTDPGALADTLRDFAAGPLAPLAFVVAFVLGGFVVFPVTVLITGTGMVFDPAPAMAIASAGVLASASASWALGRLLGRDLGPGALASRLGPRLESASRAVADRGILAVATLRMLPVAPFSIVSLAIGASRIGFSDFLVGTALGMAPGLVVLPLLGTRLIDVARNPQPLEIALLGLVFALWVAFSIGLQVFVRRRRARVVET